MNKQHPEVNVLLMQVENRFGRLTKPADFENLSLDIENTTSEQISVSTLKRLWGYVSYPSNPRLFTLDVLSRYIGFQGFSHFCDSLRANPEFVSGFLTEESLVAESLLPHQRVRIGWNPDRLVTLEYQGNNRFTVVEVQNASLRPGDSFILPAIVKGYPVYIPHIERDSKLTPMYVAGYRDGITLIKKL